MNDVHGRFCTKRLHRNQNCWSLGLGARCLIGVRHDLTTKLSATITTATNNPTKSRSMVPRKMIPKSDNEAKAINDHKAARVVTSMR